MSTKPGHPRHPARVFWTLNAPVPPPAPRPARQPRVSTKPGYPRRPARVFWTLNQQTPAHTPRERARHAGRSAGLTACLGHTTRPFPPGHLTPPAELECPRNPDTPGTPPGCSGHSTPPPHPRHHARVFWTLNAPAPPSAPHPARQLECPRNPDTPGTPPGCPGHSTKTRATRARGRCRGRPLPRHPVRGSEPKPAPTTQRSSIARPGSRSTPATSVRKRAASAPSTSRWSNERLSVSTSRSAISP
ncbi:hypothetical protein DEU35_3254 [Microbacterium sp. AG157]|nr:hypothetical protein DEU35_3254 [Microbacterium sp. AG157]